MARGKIKWYQRQELHRLLHWCREPVHRPFELFVKICVRSFLDGVDPVPILLKKGVPDFTAERAVHIARVFINNERGKRRRFAAQILEERNRNSRSFTTENFRVTIDPLQDRNYGMTSTSIYCVIEVWNEEDDVEKEYLVNFSDFRTKDWLTRLLVWGLKNKKEILIKPATDIEMNSMRMFSPKDKSLEE